MKGSPRALAAYRYWTTPPISNSVPEGIFSRIATHDPSSPAVVSPNFSDISYGELAAGYGGVSRTLADLNLPNSQRAPARIGLLQTPGVDWIRSLFGIWKAGYIAVPLSPAYPEKALRPLIEDADITTIICDGNDGNMRGDNYAGAQLLSADAFRDSEIITTPFEEDFDNNDYNDLDKCRMLLYTSGTTGNPKGVIWNERMIRHHVSTLSHAWKWANSDVALAALPLHHVHGIVNVILTAIYSGASLRITPKFSAEDTWRAIMRGEITVFMGVPTMYRRLLQVYQASNPQLQEEIRDAARDEKKMRLFVTGSAALPIQDAAAWAALTGSIPLERYGMTETGMILSNPYVQSQRVPASLGLPLPGTQIRVSEDDDMLWVKGDGVTPGYWHARHTNTCSSSSSNDGWFETGDIVEYNEECETMHFVGRQSVDIVKTAGFKVSALEIENIARHLECVDQVAVVGVHDSELGERIVAYVVVSQEDRGTDIDSARKKIWKNWRDTLPRYKIPRNLILVDQLPRNQLGKVQKVELKRQWAQHEENRNTKSKQQQ